MALHDLPIPPELAVEFEPLDADDFAAYFEYLDTHEGQPGSLDEAVEHPEQYATHVRDAVPVHRWRVEDDGAAEWACRSLALANEELRRLREQADDWAARIQLWFEQAARTHERTAAFMTDRLEDYGLRVRAAGGPSSLVLPSGSVRTTAHKAAVEVDDDDVVAHWLEDHITTADMDAAFGEDPAEWPDVTKLTAKVYVGPLRKLVTVREVDAGNRAHLTLRCGHSVSWDMADPDPTELPVIGEFVACHSCPVAERADGDVVEPVAAVEVEHLTRMEVVSPAGLPVPGVSVRPASVTAKAEAR